MFVPNFMKISLSVIKIKLLMDDGRTDDGRKVMTIAYGLSAGKLKSAVFLTGEHIY